MVLHNGWTRSQNQRDPGLILETASTVQALSKNSRLDFFKHQEEEEGVERMHSGVG